MRPTPAGRGGSPSSGRSAAAAQLEGSKAFAKDVMTAAGVPTAGHWVCEGDAARGAGELEPPYVVKHDGLAAGKGVVVTSSSTRRSPTRRASGW